MLQRVLETNFQNIPAEYTRRLEKMEEELTNLKEEAKLLYQGTEIIVIT